jgi:16S rRNA (guanine1207-N2)-methyltransferase
MDEHYYTENPTSEIKEKSFTYTIKNSTLRFTAVSGVFAFDQRVDKASELLIKNFSPSGSTVLDLGCGYGPIGLFIKSVYPQLEVNMTDVNNRAVQYSQINAKNNNLKVNILQSDLFSSLSGKTFDDIVSNPPIAIGKKLLTTFINESKSYLTDNGALWLVAFHNKGGSTLKEIMRSTFGNVEDIEKSGGIRVYKAVNHEPAF